MINGIFSDELSRDLVTAVELCERMQLKRIELRVLRTGRVPRIGNAEFDEVVDVCRHGDVALSSISPGICKETFSEASSGNAQALTRESIDFAHRVGASKITIFGFRRIPGEDRMPPAAIETIRWCVDTIHAAGVVPAIENWQSSYVPSAEAFARLKDSTDGLAPLKLDWDPCNEFGYGGHPSRFDLSLLAEVSSVQVKDGDLKAGSISHVPLGTGGVGWREIIRLLRRQDYAGDLTLESHAVRRVCSTQDDLTRFNELWRQAS